MMHRCRLLLGLASTVAFAACSDGVGPGGTGHVTVRLASGVTAAAGAPSAASPVTVSLGSDELEITSVQLVARKLRLGRAPSSCPAEDPAAAGAESSGESPDNCALLRLGPLLLDPPLTEESELSFEADIPAGTYSRIRMQIHMPEGSADAAFLADHPELDGVSIRVEGTFNGTPFTFTSALTVEEEIVLEEDLVVEDGAATTLTLVLDVKTWFVDQGGTALIDPATTDQMLKSRIEQAIRASFKAEVE